MLDALQVNPATDGCASITLDYEPNLFVAPPQAQHWVSSMVNRWQENQGQEPARRGLGQRRAPASSSGQVLRLIGERGVGKTWLLRHLARDSGQVCPQAVYLDLAERTALPTPEEYVAAVRDAVCRQSGGKRALLLLDTVPVLLDDHLRHLEDEILKPHVTLHGSLVIMALVHPSRACWRAPALRGGDGCRVLPFEQAETHAQLQQLAGMGLARHGLDAPAIQDSSGGLPLLNYLLSGWERQQAFELMLDYCFSSVPPENRAQVRIYLEAVCVLEVLEHAAIDRALHVYYRLHPHIQGHPAPASEVRNTLREYWLARSAPDLPGRTILVESVRRATREVLKARDAKLYAAMNEAAYGSKGWRS
jgi:hypothetical protein